MTTLATMSAFVTVMPPVPGQRAALRAPAFRAGPVVWPAHSGHLIPTAA